MNRQKLNNFLSEHPSLTYKAALRYLSKVKYFPYLRMNLQEQVFIKILNFNTTNFKIHLIKKHLVMVCVNRKDSKQEVVPQTEDLWRQLDEEASLWQRESGIKY